MRLDITVADFIEKHRYNHNFTDIPSFNDFVKKVRYKAAKDDGVASFKAGSSKSTIRIEFFDDCLRVYIITYKRGVIGVDQIEFWDGDIERCLFSAYEQLIKHWRL